MTKHTPGPWETDDDGDQIYIWVPAVRDYVAIVQDFGWGAPYKANARLIAAAPDMLKELQWLYEKYGHQSTADVITKAAHISAE